MATQEQFEEALAKGTEAEDFVYEWLKQNYSYVQDSRYQTRDKGTGPRLEGKEKSVILPDFIIYDKFRGAHAVDVKSKTSVYTIDGGRYFTVDDYKFDNYIKCVELMRLDGLILIFKFENDLYFYTEKDRGRKHWFANVHGNGSYLFEFDKKRIRR
jgi:hypothetical protein